MCNIRASVSISIGICIRTFSMVDLEVNRKLLFKKKDEKSHHTVVMVSVNISVSIIVRTSISVIASYQHEH